MAEAEINQGFTEIFHEMAAAWRAAPAPDGIAMPEVTRAGLAAVEALAVAHGWMARVIRSGEAALILARTGYAEEASPLVRSMLEHAIGLWWLADKRGDAFQVLVRQKAYLMTRLDRVQEIGWTVGDEDARELLRQAIEVETDENTRSLDRLASVAAQAREYGLGPFLQAWMVESWTSHAGLPSASAYYDYRPAPDQSVEEVALLITPRDTRREVAGAVAVATHTALLAYNKVLQGEPLSEALTEWQLRVEQLSSQLAEYRQRLPQGQDLAAREGNRRPT